MENSEKKIEENKEEINTLEGNLSSRKFKLDEINQSINEKEQKKKNLNEEIDDLNKKKRDLRAQYIDEVNKICQEEIQIKNILQKSLILVVAIFLIMMLIQCCQKKHVDITELKKEVRSRENLAYSDNEVRSHIFCELPRLHLIQIFYS